MEQDLLKWVHWNFLSLLEGKNVTGRSNIKCIKHSMMRACKSNCARFMVTCWIFPPCLPGQESSSLASGCKLQGGACPGTPALLTSPYKSCSRQDSCLHSSAYYCCCFQPGETHSIWSLEAVVLSKTANLKVAKDGLQAISSGLRYVQLRNLLNPMLLNHLFQLSIHAF